jgi:hypothetical protein
MIVATAPTKERILTLIKKFYYSENIVITDNNEVLNTKLNKKVGIVTNSKKRFQFLAI